MLSRKPLLVAWILVVALVGCSGSDGDEGDATDSGRPPLRQLVLQPDDLSKEFVRFDEGRLNLVDYRPGLRQSRTRFGREDGWKARYRRRGGPQTAGPLVVESLVDVFAEEEGAERDLSAYETELGRPWRRLPDPTLGDDAIAVTLGQGFGRFAQRFFTIAWREGKSTASITVNGYEGKLTLQQALALARKQEARLRRSS